MYQQSAYQAQQPVYQAQPPITQQMYQQYYNQEMNKQQ
jgi:hypothetical protein